MKSIEEIFDFRTVSPVQVDYWRKVDYDEEGNEIITWPEVDYSQLQQSLGIVGDWSLTNLLKAGINPDFPIHTGLPTRLEGVNMVNNIEQNIDSLFDNSEYVSPVSLKDDDEK